MQKNIFEMGAKLEDGWRSDNKKESVVKISIKTKTVEKHQLYFAKEKRRGKIVTIVYPFYLHDKTLKSLLKTLKKKLGTGGTPRENSLEFQGDIVEPLKRELNVLGYRFKI